MGEDTYNNNVFLVFVEQNENFLLQLSAGWIENVPDPGEYPYLFYTTGGTNSKPVSVTLYSTLGENQNLKPVNNVLAIRVDGTLYRLEDASRELVTIGGIAPAVFTAVRQSASESINVLTNQTRNIDFAMLSYSEGYIKTVEVIAYADLEYTKPLANAFFVMQQLPAEANGYEFVLDEGDAEWQASVGNFESASMTGIYAPAGIHSFNVALINRSTHTGVDGATISVTKEFYTTPYVANKSFFETITYATSEGLWESTESSWLRVLVGGGEVGGATYTTGSNGYPAGSPTPEMEIEWLQNSTNETIKRCVVTLAVTGVEGNCSVVYEFYQRANVAEYAVVFYDGENYYENGSVRSVDADYSEQSAGYVAILCDKSVGYSEISGATYEYGVSDATKGVSIDETEGVITLSPNIEAGTEVDIIASGILSGNEVAYSSYKLRVKAAAQTAHITHNIPATATYLDSDIIAEAYSDSGAVVTFSTQSSKVTLGQTEIIEAVRNGVTVSVTRQWIGIAGASTGTGETINLSCPATETYKVGSTSAKIKIDKYNDYVSIWDGPYVNGTKQNALAVGSVNTFYVTTGTGNQPVSYGYDSGTTTIEHSDIKFSKTNTGFTIKPLTTGNVGLVASLNYDANFGPGQNDSREILLSTQPANSRQVYFLNEPYQITVNGSPTQLSWAFNPASANSGTPTFSCDKTKLNITNTNNQWYVVGLAKGSFDLTIEYPASGLYSRCYDTTTISVGLIPTTTLVWQNTPGSSTAIPLDDTSQVALATDTNAPNRTVKYTSSDENIVKISMYGGAITPKAQGTAIIYAEVQETNTYAYKKIQYDIAIGNATPTPTCTVTFSNPSATYQVQVGSTFTKAISSKTPNDSNTYIEYTSSKNSIATVNASGQVTGIAAGTVTITATATRSGYNPGTASYQITVTPVSVTDPVITVGNPSVTIYLPNDQQLPTSANLNASVNNSVQTVKYTSLSPSAVSVSNDGTVTGITTGSNLVIRIYVEATGSYAAKETTAKVTVLQANTPTQDTTDVVDFTQTTTMQTVDVLLGNKYYNKAEATVSHRPVYYSVSNSTIASILYARVQVNGAVENNVITLTTSGNKTVTFKITASSSSTSKNGQTLEWSTDSTTSFTVKTGDVFYVHAALLESGGSKASYYSNSTSVMWSSASSNIVGDGGVLVGKTASSNPVEVRAQVYAGQSGGVNYTAAYDTYYATISAQMPTLRFKYLPSDIQEGAQQFSFSRTSQLLPDFNVPIYDNIHAGYFEWCYNADSGNTSNTSIATVSNEGLVTLVGGVGEVSVKAAIAAHGNYGRVEASYTMIISGYYINLSQSQFTIGGRGGSITVRATSMKVMNGAADEAYNATPTVEGGCQRIVPNNGTSQTTAVLSTYHDITYSFGINHTDSDIETTRTIYSNIGSASATVTITQTSGSGNPSELRYEHNDITRGNANNIDNNTVYEHTSLWSYSLNQEDINGFVHNLDAPCTWRMGDERVISNVASNDEATSVYANERLTHASGDNTPIWMEAYHNNSRVTTSTSGVATSISYVVEYWSEDYGEWTTDTSKTGQGQWCGVYVGDGNSHTGSYAPSQSNTISLGSTGKIYPHIEWLANGSGETRYARVIFCYGGYDYKNNYYPIYVAKIIQQG
ncbi:MAG: Ig-like domain-containing protein [Bacteroidales bacterium]|nr:Ig-like domain-containing protein [Bacteroidales bacterium]